MLLTGQSLVQWLAAAQQNQAQAAVVSQTPVQAPPATSLRSMEQLTSQQAALHDQILESEQNLNAQHSVSDTIPKVHYRPIHSRISII